MVSEDWNFISSASFFLFLTFRRLAFVAGAHQGSVQGVVSDGLNEQVVSGGIDCFLKFWRFSNGQLLSKLDLDASISKLHLHRERYCNFLAALEKRIDFVCMLVY